MMTDATISKADRDDRVRRAMPNFNPGNSLISPVTP